MTTALSKNRCAKCDKDKSTLRCGGCLQEYCVNHSFDHRQELNKQLDDVELARHLFRQTLLQQANDPEKHALIQQINDWEHDSVVKIRQTAEEARQTLLKHTTGYAKQIEIDLNKLTDQLRQSREDNDFYETDLRCWNEELKRLANELAKPSNINLRQDTASLINRISVGVTSTTISNLPDTTVTTVTTVKEIKNRIIVAGGNGQGNRVDQLSCPNGLYVDDDQTIYIAEWSNHRILEWKSGATSGQVVAGGNGQGNRTDQLSNPTDVIVDKENDTLIICDYGNKRVMRWPRQNGTNGEVLLADVACWGIAMDNNKYLYISDINKHEVKRWIIGDANGTVVAGGNGQGTRLNQLNYPYYIFVDQDHSIYVSDGNNHRVVKWMKGAKEGILVAGVHGKGNGMTQLSNPRGIVVNQLGNVYVADCSNYRIMRWSKGATQGSVVVGGNGQGVQPTQFTAPLGLSVDRQDNLYVADYGNHRVQQFNIGPNTNTQPSCNLSVEDAVRPRTPVNKQAIENDTHATYKNIEDILVKNSGAFNFAVIHCRDLKKIDSVGPLQVFKTVSERRPRSGVRGLVRYDDNTRSHRAGIINELLAKNLAEPNPPYSPDLSSCEFFLFECIDVESDDRAIKLQRLEFFNEFKYISVYADVFLLMTYCY